MSWSQAINKRSICCLLIILVYLSTVSITHVKAIGCYKCTSTNNDTGCEDPFNPGQAPVNYYESECKSGIPGRVGLFPARFCLKVSGYIANTKEQIVIRTCTVSKLLDSDSSHSSFTLQLSDDTSVQVVSGLIASCKDDGCNGATSSLYLLHSRYLSLIILVTLSALLHVLFNIMYN